MPSISAMKTGVRAAGDPPQIQHGRSAGTNTVENYRIPSSTGGLERNRGFGDPDDYRQRPGGGEERLEVSAENDVRSPRDVVD